MVWWDGGRLDDVHDVFSGCATAGVLVLAFASTRVFTEVRMADSPVRAGIGRWADVGFASGMVETFGGRKCHDFDHSHFGIDDWIAIFCSVDDGPPGSGVAKHDTCQSFTVPTVCVVESRVDVGVGQLSIFG